MASKAQPIRVGPFTGGLNTYSDPSTIGDEECAYVNNFDVDITGSLLSRPPMTRMANSGFFDQRLLGSYTSAAGTAFILMTSITATNNQVVAYNITANTYAVIGTGLLAAFKISSMVQWQGKCWFVQDPGVSGTGGFSWDGTTWAVVAAMPKGTTCCIYKERIFIGTGKNAASPSQVFFCGAANPASWTVGTDFFNVSNGDGQPILRIYSYSGSLVIFKTDSTYGFAYESAPTKGQVQMISSTIGLDNADCLAETEGTLYVMADSRVYTISNWNWEQQNVKVPFSYVNAHTGFSTRNSTISVMGNRIICRYFDSIYIFGHKTKAWTLWSSALAPDFWVQSPIKDITTGIETYFAGNYLLNDATNEPKYIYRLKDTYTSVDIEAGVLCEVRSKVYNMDVPYSFKRLLWWGADLLANSSVQASIIPVTYGTPVRWSDITSRNLTWATRVNYTWGAPLDISLRVDDVASIKNFNHVRMFVKYIKSVRFRQIQFVLKSTLDGSTTTGPFQIFSITAFVINKEIVTKQVS